MQPGAAPGTVHLWGIAGSAVCSDAVATVAELAAAVDRIVDGLHGADGDTLAFVPQAELDRRWVVYRWLRSGEGQRWSVPVRDTPPAVLQARVGALAREALGMF